MGHERSYQPGVHTVNGVQILLPDGPTVGAGGEYHMAIGTYEMGEVAFVSGRLGPGGGFVDVGAHIGYFSVPAAAIVGTSGVVIAIEPTAASAEVLERNVELNGFGDRMTVVEAAASAKSGTGTLYVSTESDMWSSLEPEVLDGLVERPIRLVTVDEVVAEHGWPVIDVVKIDVEGHELSVLHGAAQTLERNPSVDVIFEASGMSQERFDVSLSAIEFLASSGYEFRSLDRRGGTHPESVDSLVARMRMDRWQDALFNAVASRSRR